MSKILAFYNMSGGVGKSTLTMNLGYHLAKDHKKRVLLIDLDPQASLTVFMGINPFTQEETALQSLIDKKPLPITEGLHHCDFVPSNILLAQAELRLASELRREYRLKEALKKVTDDYDIILLDCPPSLGLLSVNCLTAADFLLIPIQTEYKSVQATICLMRTTCEIAYDLNEDLRVLGAIPTMYDQKLKQANEALEKITSSITKVKKEEPSMFGKAKVYTPIPRRTDFAKASAQNIPLAELSPRLDAVKILTTTATELTKIL